MFPSLKDVDRDLTSGSMSTCNCKPPPAGPLNITVAEGRNWRPHRVRNGRRMVRVGKATNGLTKWNLINNHQGAFSPDVGSSGILFSLFLPRFHFFIS